MGALLGDLRIEPCGWLVVEEQNIEGEGQMTPGEEEQAGLVPAQSAAFAPVAAKSLVARGRTGLQMREEAEEWLRKGLELQQAAPDDPRRTAPVNPYARANLPLPNRFYSLRQIQAAAEYIEHPLAGDDPQAAAKSLGMTPEDQEMAHVAHFFMPTALMEIAGKSATAIPEKTGPNCTGIPPLIPEKVPAPAGMDDGVLKGHDGQGGTINLHVPGNPGAGGNAAGAVEEARRRAKRGVRVL